jgi:hypothetical protein
MAGSQPQRPVADALAKLAELRAAGHLSDGEFQDAKARLLADQAASTAVAPPTAPAAAMPKPSHRIRNIVIGGFGLLLLLAAIGAAGKQSPGPTSGPAGNGGGNVPTARDYVVVTYLLTGSAPGADITYTDGSGNIQQQNGLAVPLTKKSDHTPGISFPARHGSFMTFSAQNTGESGDLTCAIQADGLTINTGRASGVVSCSAQLP